MAIRSRRRTVSGTAMAICLMLSAGTALGHAPEYTAPRTADGRPDLNGIWQTINTAIWGIEPRAAGPSMVLELGAIAVAPPGTGIVDRVEIRYLPKANITQRTKPTRRSIETGLMR